MSAVATVTGFRELALASLVFSKSPAQTERRNSYDKTSLKELAENIKSTGVIQPIVVRPNGKPDQFEVVAGERRVTASREAGLEVIPGIVRDLTDEQALDINLVENLQRQALHELVECEGYEDLKARGHTVEQIAAKVGKSTSYVYKRLELSACGPDIRKAFYAGEIDASKALFLSRLQGNDLQKKALKDVVTGWGHEGMSYRHMVEHVRRNYMQRLDQAKFNTEDAELVAGVGACSACRMNSAAAVQTALFGNVSKENGCCSDGKCFAKKTLAATKVAVIEAKAAGHVVLEGKAAAKALQGKDAKYVKPHSQVPGDSRWRSFQTVLGKDLEKAVTLAVDPETGEKVELVDKEKARAVIKELGIKLSAPRSSSGSSAQRTPKETEKQKADRLKEEAEHKLHAAILKAIHEKAPKPFDDDELGEIAEMFEVNGFGNDDMLEAVLGKGMNVSKLNAAGLIRYIRTHILVEHLEEGDKKVVLDSAKRHGVDVEKIKASLEPKPVKVAAAPAKKAAKKK
jgi:ParB/RepB/Spo0J family partition protein